MTWQPHVPCLAPFLLFAEWYCAHWLTEHNFPTLLNLSAESMSCQIYRLLQIWHQQHKRKAEFKASSDSQWIIQGCTGRTSLGSVCGDLPWRPGWCAAGLQRFGRASPVFWWLWGRFQVCHENSLWSSLCCTVSLTCSFTNTCFALAALPHLFSFLHHLIPFLLPISSPPLLSLIKLAGALIKCNLHPPHPPPPPLALLQWD